MKLILEKWNRFILLETIKNRSKDLLKENDDGDPNSEYFKKYSKRLDEIVSLVMDSDFDEDKINQARTILQYEEIDPRHAILKMLIYFAKAIKHRSKVKPESSEFMDLEDIIESMRLSLEAFVNPEGAGIAKIIGSYEEGVSEIANHQLPVSVIKFLTKEYAEELAYHWEKSIPTPRDSQDLGKPDSPSQASQDANKRDSPNLSRNQPGPSNVSLNRPD